MLVDAFPVEMVGHARQLDLAMQGLVAHAQQGAVGHAEAEAVGGDGGALHVQRDGTALAEAALRAVVGQQLPVAVVGAGNSAGAHDVLELGALHLRDIGHRLLQGHLDLGQGRDGHPQRQFFVQDMVFAHIPVCQHIVAQVLGVAQAGTVAEHDPGMGAQHCDMVGDVLGIGRTHTDVHHGDAAAVRAQQMVAGHLRQAQRLRAIFVARLGRQSDAAGDHVAGLDKGDVVAGRVLHGGAAQAHELVDVELVVGEQHEILEVLGRRAGVVAQPMQRVVDPRRREQGQGLRLAGAGLEGPVGNAVIHGGQVGQVEHVAHLLAPVRAQVAFDVVMLGEREVHRDRLVTDTDLQFDLVVLQQQRELLQVVIAKQVRTGERGLELPRPGHEAIAQARTVGAAAAQHGIGLHAHVRVTRPHMAGQRVAGHITLHGLAQMRQAQFIDLARLRQRGDRVGMAGSGDRGGKINHGAIVHNGVTLSGTALRAQDCARDWGCYRWVPPGTPAPGIQVL